MMRGFDLWPDSALRQFPWFFPAAGRILPLGKVLHIVSVIAWMAAMLYSAAAFFVYHAEAGPGSPQSETFKIIGTAPAAGDHDPGDALDLVFRSLDGLDGLRLHGGMAARKNSRRGRPDRHAWLFRRGCAPFCRRSRSADIRGTGAC